MSGLRDELSTINFERTPIRNFIDARPTPKSVAGTLIKLGLLNVSDVDDYDWQSLDYEAFPTVRAMLKHYARATPTTNLEALLSEAGKMLIKDEPSVGYLNNPFENDFVREVLTNPEAYGYRSGAEALAYYVADPLMLEEIEPQLARYISTRDHQVEFKAKPPKELVIKALAKAISLARDVADELWGEDSEEYRQFVLKVKSALVNSPLKKVYSAKELSEIATEALSRAGLLSPRKKPALTRTKAENVMLEKALSLLKRMQENPQNRALAILFSAQLSPSTIEKIKSGQYKPEVLLKYGPDGYAPFAYAVLSGSPLAIEAIEKDPKKAYRILKELGKALLYIEEAITTAKSSGLKIPLKGLSFQTEKALRDILVRYFAHYIEHLSSLPGFESAPPGLLPGLIKPAPTVNQEQIKETIKNVEKVLDTLRMFLPKTVEAIEGDIETLLSQENLILPNPEQVKAPSLFNPKSLIKAELVKKKVEALKEKARRSRLKPEEERFLWNAENEGVKVDGQVLIWNGKILHRVKEVNIPGYGWVDLYTEGIYLWYDPESGRYYEQTVTSRGTNLKSITLAEFRRKLAKLLSATAPTAPATGGTGWMSFKDFMKNLDKGKKVEIVPPVATEPPESLRNLASTAPLELMKVIEYMQKNNPLARENIEQLLKLSKTYSTSEMLGAIEFVERALKVPPSDPRFSSYVWRALVYHRTYGRWGI